MRFFYASLIIIIFLFTGCYKVHYEDNESDGLPYDPYIAVSEHLLPKMLEAFAFSDEIKDLQLSVGDRDTLIAEYTAKKFFRGDTMLNSHVVLLHHRWIENTMTEKLMQVMGSSGAWVAPFHLITIVHSAFSDRIFIFRFFVTPAYVRRILPYVVM